MDGSDKCIGDMAFGLFVPGSVIVVNVTNLKTCCGALRRTDA